MFLQQLSKTTLVINGGDGTRLAYSPDKVRQEMAVHLHQYRSSNLSQLEYCRVNKLSICKLQYWLKKSRAEKRKMKLI